MGFIGNQNGPRKSEIVLKLGYKYFGITPEELNEEINLYLEEENRGEVDPVYVDNNDKPYILFYAPTKRVQKFFLEEHGYFLEGNILTHAKE